MHLPSLPAGNVLFSFENVTISCHPDSEAGAAAGAAATQPALPTPLASSDGVGIAGNAADLIHYLKVHAVREILVAGGSRSPAGWQGNPGGC